jgi:uncharacterized RDD family membrane protein YckC
MTDARWRDRLHGFLLDVLPFFGIVALLSFALRERAQSLPFLVGTRVVFGAFLLLRDLAGASPGKRARKMQIVSASGEPVDGTQLFLRNTTLAAAPLSADVPVLAQATLLLLLVDAVFVFIRGARLGDLLAGTRVVTTTAAARAAAPPTPDEPTPPTD